MEKMKRLFALLVISIFSYSGLSVYAQSKIVDKFEKWLHTQPDLREIVRLTKKKKSLSATEAESIREMLWNYRAEEIKKQYASSWKLKLFTEDEFRMRFDYRVFGEKPADGWSLYISMHGGGGAPAALNDQQWRNQIGLYQPQEGIYLAPRAPLNTWDLWHQPHIDALFEQIIKSAVVLKDVNPDRVYITGYSAGGDGTYRLAPRMADRWAAAAMMAGHPGDVSPLSLRNIGFALWMGADDAAYNRNQVARQWEIMLDSLHKNDPGGYVHDVHIVPGKGHWMDREDRAGIEWMSHFTRNPYPEKIVWKQDNGVLHGSFYWLSVPDDLLQSGGEIVVTRKGNTVYIEKNYSERLTIFLNDEMFDLDKPITVVCNGKNVFKGKVKRNLASLYNSLLQKDDPRYLFCASITLDDVRTENKMFFIK